MRKALLSIAVLLFALVMPSQAFAQCTNPDGVSGVMVWNQDYCVTQICDGTQWIAVHPRPINCLGGPGDNTPNVFDFTDVADANLGVQYTDSVTVEGFVVAPLTASVSGGGAEIRNVTNASAWGASADMNPGEELAIRMSASGSLDTAKTAQVTLGTATVDWVVSTPSTTDTTPDAFDFVDVVGAALSTQYDDTVTVTGFDGPLTASVTGGGAEIRNNTLASAWGSTADLNPGNVLEIRMTSDANFATAKTADVTLGTASVDWVVTTSGDTTDPVWSTAAGTVATINTGDALSTTVTATDDSGSVSYSKQSGDAWISVNSSTGALTGTAPGSAGTYSITVRAQDPSGNFVDRSFDAVVQDGDPVWQTAAGTVATIDAGTALSTSVTATDDSGSVSYAKQSGDAWISVNSSTGELTGTANCPASFSVTEDFGGSGALTNFVNVTGDNHDWSGNSGDTGSNGVGPTAGDGGSGGYAYTEASSPVAANETFFLQMVQQTGLDTGPCPARIEFAWNKRGDDMGDLYLEYAINGGGWTTAWSHLGADMPKDATDVWRIENVQLVPVNGTLDVRFRAVMPPSGTIWHSDIAVDSITVTDDGTLPFATYSITVRAEDPGGNFVDRTFDVVVQDNTDPVWSTAAGTVATINTGDSLSTTVTATDDSGSVSYARQSGDAWISVNSSTGVLTGTAPGSAGTSSITVRAEDPSGNSTDRTFNVVVNAQAGCSSAGVSWGGGCSRSITSGSHGQTLSVTDSHCCSPACSRSCSGKKGSATFQCNNGTWVYQSGSCNTCNETGCVCQAGEACGCGGTYDCRGRCSRDCR